MACRRDRRCRAWPTSASRTCAPATRPAAARRSLNAGRGGLQTTNIAFLIYSQALLHYDVGAASAGGLVAVVLANIVALFLVGIVGRNLEA
jgi:hypothetical protein